MEVGAWPMIIITIIIFIKATDCTHTLHVPMMLRNPEQGKRRLNRGVTNRLAPVRINLSEKLHRP